MVEATSAAVTEQAATPDLLELTLGTAIRDAQTVTAKGESTSALLHGVERFHVPTQVDDRGWLVELFDPRWDWVDEPLVYSYATTVRPGLAKGWAIHREHSDRYFLLVGRIEVVLYDVRPESPTVGRISRIAMSEFDRGILKIPQFIWHATRNIGEAEAVFVNFPTMQFNHANPDKYRLPIDTPLIPFSFGTTPGW